VAHSDVIIVEGILLFSTEKMKNFFDLKIYVEASSESRFARRIERDIKERGRNLDSVISTYLAFVKPSYEKYIEPTKYFADITVNNEHNDGDHNLSSKISIVMAYVLDKSK
jgi:uridine kinase